MCRMANFLVISTGLDHGQPELCWRLLYWCWWLYKETSCLFAKSIPKTLRYTLVATSFRVDVQIKAVSSVRHKTNPFSQFLNCVQILIYAPGYLVCGWPLIWWWWWSNIYYAAHSNTRWTEIFKWLQHVSVLWSYMGRDEITTRHRTISTSAAELYIYYIAWPTRSWG